MMMAAVPLAIVTVLPLSVIVISGPVPVPPPGILAHPGIAASRNSQKKQNQQEANLVFSSSDGWINLVEAQKNGGDNSFGSMNQKRVP
jgi:hypothetical protein